MVKGGRGGVKRGAPAGRAPAPAQNDADEAMEDARAASANLLVGICR